jgi:peptidyl-tRNA hydrolase
VAGVATVPAAVPAKDWVAQVQDPAAQVGAVTLALGVEQELAREVEAGSVLVAEEGPAPGLARATVAGAM